MSNLNGMSNLKSITTVILLASSFLFTACFENSEKKEPEKKLLTGKPTQQYAKLSQKYFAEGEYQKALEYDQKQLAEDLKYYQEQRAEISLDYNNIGLDYDELKEYAKAIEYYTKAMKIDDVTLEQNSTERATTFYNIASAQDALENYEEALKYYKKALAIDRVGMGEFSEDVFNEYVDISIVYEKKGKLKEALRYLEQALTLNEHLDGKEAPLTKKLMVKVTELQSKIK